jgi:hypothetical protein
MNDCFLYYYGTDSKFEDANLRFYQKLTLLEGKNKSFEFYFKGIKEINRIRNRLAHKLDTKITIDDVKFTKPSAEFLIGERIKELIEIIEVFTMMACVFLENYISEFGKRHVKDIEEIVKKEKKLNALPS